jgi:hypothetical protein
MSIPARERLDPEAVGLVGRPASRELVSVRQRLDALTAHLTVQPTTYRCKTQTRTAKFRSAVVQRKGHTLNLLGSAWLVANLRICRQKPKYKFHVRDGDRLDIRPLHTNTDRINTTGSTVHSQRLNEHTNGCGNGGVEHGVPCLSPLANIFWPKPCGLSLRHICKQSHVKRICQSPV